MPGVFNNKIFNAEVFQGYIERIPNLRRTELIKSRAIRPRPDLAQSMRDQVGGNYITTPLRGLISGMAPLNYDGKTDITAESTVTFRHSRVVTGRAKAWKEDDFSYDITGGEDFAANIAQQIADYWNEVDQDTLVHILNGIFNMTGSANAKFVDAHTLDVCGVQNSNGVTGNMDQTTLNTAMQKACGDNKGAFTLLCIHSAVATNLENLKLLTYLKYNDANGMEREIGLGTLNGRLVLVDDSMPTVNVASAAGVYTVTIGGTVAAGDKIAVNGIQITLDATSGASKNAAAAALATALGADADFAAKFTIANSSSPTVTLTEKSGYYGIGKPDAEITSAAGTIAVATTTEPANSYVKYTSYALGDGAIEFTDCGCNTPYEVDRDPKTNGGQDLLYSRQRKCFAPYGISFTAAVMSSLSPTDAELENGANWELVNSMGDAGQRQYINHRAIPIARILSRG
ncbi:MAG: phage coat protein [Oscillospiraceae bacterium]|nr:phage coat protein [Oscillospiraceae bacterium]